MATTAEFPTMGELQNRDGIEILRQISGDFPQSLVEQYESGRQLSQKQWHWVGKLAHEHLTKPPQSPVQVELGPIMAMFNLALEHLKRPKIRISNGEGELCFSIAGPRSKHHGAVMITDGKPFGENTFYGRIHQDGTFERSRHCTDEVLAIVQRFADQPAEVAAAYGRKTGNCSFCNRTLTDKRSVSIGIGPVCADRYGIAYPTRAEVDARESTQMPSAVLDGQSVEVA